MTATCRSCGGRVLFGRTPAGKLMPLEYDQRFLPPGTVRNVAYFRHTSGHVECVTLTVDQARVANVPGTRLDEVLPDLVNAEFYTLTVAHFVTCPAAVEHRKARRGEVANVRPMPRRKPVARNAPSQEVPKQELAPVVPLRSRLLGRRRQ